MHDLLDDGLAGEVHLTAVAEGNHAVLECEERVVVAHAYVFTCVNLGTALADDNHARAGLGTVGELNPEVFRV